MSEENKPAEGAQGNTSASDGKKALEDAGDNKPLLNAGDKGAGGQSMLKGEDSEKTGGEGEKETPGAPEKYEDFEVPDGFTFESEPLQNFKEMAKGLNLTQDGAQKLVGFYLAEQERTQNSHEQKWELQRKTWRQELRADNEFGGNNFDQTLERANRMLRRFGENDLIGYLDKSGLADYPGMVRLLAKIDAALGEDRLVEGKPGQEAEKTMAQILYPGGNK